MFLFSYFSAAVAKDEPPDQWDEEEEEEEEKETLRMKDKDLEFLFQDVVRDNSLDQRLKTDLQSKKSDPKYKEMLVSIVIRVVFIQTAMQVKAFKLCSATLVVPYV